MARTPSSPTLLPVVGAHSATVSSTQRLPWIWPHTSTLGLDATGYLYLVRLARLVDRDWRLEIWV